MTEADQSPPSVTTEPDPTTQHSMNDSSDDYLTTIQEHEASSVPPAVSSPTVVMTQEQFELLLKTLKPNTTTSGLQQQLKPKPRVGGRDEQGDWTGYGQNKLGKEPESHACYREFLIDTGIKAMQEKARIHDRCKQGLRGYCDTLFRRDTESGGGQGGQAIMEFSQYVVQHGLEGVFTIVLSTGTIDMFKSPGLATLPVVKTWVKDLLYDGVRIPGSLDRHPVCPYDRVNLQLSAQALLNSCSDLLRQDLLASLQPGEKYGPIVLRKILDIVYRSELAKLKELTDKLEAMNITKFPGEDVSLFKQEAAALIRDIQRHFTSPEPVANLAVLAIKGLAHSTYQVYQNWIVTKIRKINGDPARAKNPTVALDLLDQVEAEYLSLKSMHLYPPALKPNQEENRFKAMQAELSQVKSDIKDVKLQQDRNAGSTKGNTNNPNSNSNANGNDGSTNANTKSQQKRSKLKITAQDFGLSEEVFNKCNELIKEREKTLPKVENIPDNANLTIEVDGQVVAKFCRHCSKFKRGNTAHFTHEHKGTLRRVPYQPPTEEANTSKVPDSGQTPASSNVAASQQTFQTPTGPPSSAVHFGPRTFYDFSSMAPPPGRPGGFVARRITLTDDESVTKLLEHSDSDSSDSDDEPHPTPNKWMHPRDPPDLKE